MSVERPITLVVTDDLRRSRATVFFRLVLAIPIVIVYALWSLAALLVVVAAWVVLLVRGRLSEGLHGFLAAYVRYATRTSAYLHLVANPYPGFGTEHDYPVDVVIEGPTPQRRSTVVFRLFLALPALLLVGATGGGSQLGLRAGARGSALGSSGALTVVAILGWFASLARGSMPRGLRDLGAYGLGYTAQTLGYLLLLTDRYPSADPRLAGPLELPEHAVTLELADDLVRPRLLVLFRPLLALPHLVWLALWTVAVLLAALLGGLVALFSGRLQAGLHRFLAAYVRYATHVSAFLFVIGGPFPGFVGREGSYPVDVRIEAPRRQGRLGVLVRVVLAIPALLVAGAYGGIVLVAGILGWWYALVRGWMPRGLRDVGAIGLRYQAQTWAYVLLLTDRYPYAAPALEPPVETPPAPESWGTVA